MYSELYPSFLQATRSGFDLQYFEERLAKVGKFETYKEIYPHSFSRTHALPAFIAEYGEIEAGSRLTDIAVSLTGKSSCHWRVMLSAPE